MTEILVVIGVIVLIMALAVPAFNLIRGTRSVDSAENQIAAMLGKARADAIGLQQPHGIMFFIEPTSGRVNVAEVYAADFPDTGSPGVPATPTRDVYLDVVADTDYVPLPPGVLAFVLSNGGVTVGTSNRTSDGYLGYNVNFTNGASGPQFGGVILFNADGQVISRTYGYRTQLNNVDNRMQNLLKSNNTTTFLPATGVNYIEPAMGCGTTPIGTNNWPQSAIGFVLVDQESFLANGDLADPMFTGAVYLTSEVNEEKWIDDHSTQMIVNRYNGTLTHAD